MSLVFQEENRKLAAPKRLPRDFANRQKVERVSNRRYPGGTSLSLLNDGYTKSDLVDRYKFYYPDGPPEGIRKPNRKQEYVNLIRMIPVEEL